MEFEEVHVSQLTSPTTCYSGACHGNNVRLASETHMFYLSCEEQDTETTSRWPMLAVLPERIPRPAGVLNQAICVGYSSLETDTMRYEVFALMDPTQQLVDHEQQQSDAEEPDSSTRRQDANNNNASSSNITFSSTTTPADPPIETSTPSSAWLVMRQTLLEGDSSSSIHATSLSFRPLSPHIICLTSNDETTLVNTWIGSADDSQIRLYMLNGEGSLSLTSVVLDKNDSEDSSHSGDSDDDDDDDKSFSSTPLLFGSPVMAIDSLCVDKLNFLAVACQDGTIRLIVFGGCEYEEENGLSLQNVYVHNTIVDGPIVKLCMVETTTQGNVRILVGSLFGFVCELYIDFQEETPPVWNGPTMVVEGLWCSALDTEDCVLALDIWNNDMVAVGTQSGQVIVLQQKADKHYAVVWRCQLPYSIHSLYHVVSKTTITTTRLLVATQQTVHLFCSVKYRYSADTAKRRVEQLLKLRQQEIQT